MQVAGIRLSRWEVDQIRMMDVVFVTTVRTGSGAKRQEQGLGEYCGGKELEACRKTFGQQLERVCSTCPN